MSAAGDTSRYEFAKAIIRVMKEVSGAPDSWASVKPITSEQYPLPARRPHYPVTSKEKIERVFGMTMPHWEDQLRAFLASLAGPVSRGGDLKLLKNQNNQPQMDAHPSSLPLLPKGEGQARASPLPHVGRGAGVRA